MIRKMIAATVMLCLVNVTLAKVTTPDVQPYGKLGLVEGKYVFTRFGISPEQEEGWIDLATGKPAWPAHTQRCHKRVLGRGTCPAADPLNLRDSTLNKGDIIFNGIFTLGLQPLLGKNSATTRYDNAQIKLAVAEATAELERGGESLGSLVARFLEQSERLAAQAHRFEQAIIDTRHTLTISSDIDAEFATLYPLALIRKDIHYQWEKKGSLDADTFPALIAALEHLTSSMQSGPTEAIGSLELSCPDTVYARSMKCEITPQWDNNGLLLTGNIQVKEWHLPSTALHFDMSNERFAVRFNNGLMRITNISTDTMSLTLASPLRRNGPVPQKMLAANRFSPGQTLIYPSFLTSGEMENLNGKTIRVTKKNLDDEVVSGIRINFRVGRSHMQSTSDLKETITIAEQMKRNLAFVSAKGHGIQDTQWLKRKVMNGLSLSSFNQGNIAIANQLLDPEPLRRRF